MSEGGEVWKPGSFTKNFSWGKSDTGLSELHTVIRIGFEDRLEDVPRALFRERISKTGRPDYIPINFFLFNRIEDGESYLCADELVFQAISWAPGEVFDRIALFAFLFSFAGKWKGARKEQRRPAMWANAYIREHVAENLSWQTSLVSADDIQGFVDRDPRYDAQTSRKLATNLNFLLKIGRIQDFSNPKVTRWWVDCLFLALDRLLEDAKLDDRNPSPSGYSSLLERSGFFELTGGSNMEKKLSIKHLVRLYTALDGRNRLSNQDMIELTADVLPDTPITMPNDPRPRGAIHLTNPRILKSIPPVCSDLARAAGFEVVSPDEVEYLNASEFVSQRTAAALAVLQEKGIRPNMSLEELLKVTRER
ncbi:hypothetical protein [Phaeobacter inhibens]|uniref:hypothetical protein n=1 Tax=Phaeobacter inhibens TaxID=221822 RepID=UPI0021A58BC0|nr:hypothetical protein [Phaeobacter inhibens]UWS08264.1 hypothetical protein K4K98_00850 [Phaeobacter inhibens]